MNPESPYTQGGQTPYQPQPQPQYQPQAAPLPQQPMYQTPQQPVQPSYTPQLPPASLPPRKRSKLWVILSFVFLFTTIAAAALGVWALLNYFDQKENVDGRVSSTVAVAVKDQQDKDAANFLEKEKQPNRQFAGPDDYGRLAFNYPKTWSIYVAKDASSGGTYEAYFNPVSVPPVSNREYFALRVTIEQRDYEQVLKNYEKLVSDGSLRSSNVTADGENGTRLDGNFNDDFKGSAVIFKIRDKTVTMRTDAEAFTGDFNAIIQTITFNK